MPQDTHLHSKPLVALVAAAHGTAYADRFRDYDFDAETLYRFSDICKQVMEDVARAPGACTLMNALLAQRVRETLDAPFAIVAGALKIGSSYIFGSNAPIDGARAFSESSADFDGHVWMIFGRYLVDISLARTALSGKSHGLLAKKVRKEFGQKVGLFAMPADEVRRLGFVYLPRYVLADREIAPLARGAETYFGLGAGDDVRTETTHG